jgi:hypothetical protein
VLLQQRSFCCYALFGSGGLSTSSGGGGSSRSSSVALQVGKKELHCRWQVGGPLRGERTRRCEQKRVNGGSAAAEGTGAYGTVAEAETVKERFAKAIVVVVQATVEINTCKRSSSVKGSFRDGHVGVVVRVIHAWQHGDVKSLIREKGVKCKDVKCEINTAPKFK